MTHHTYNTNSFVLKGVPVGESNLYLTLLTRDLGLVRATGRSLRVSHSKLRHHLQDYSIVKTTLVRGRNVWRIIGAQNSFNAYSELSGLREKQILASRVCALLVRLLQDEGGGDAELFDLILSGMFFLKKTPMDTDLLKNFECLWVLRILQRLGYVGDQNNFGLLLNAPFFSRELLSEVSSHKEDMLCAINTALNASNL